MFIQRINNICTRIFLNQFSNKLYCDNNMQYWEKLLNKYKGIRGFVIANGPSLKIDDLDKLCNEITIASNKIYLAFEKTNWRPNYYTICDEVLASKINNEVQNYNLIVHAPINIGVNFLGCDVFYWKNLSAPKRPQYENLKFSADYTKGVYSGYSITYQNIQLAAHLGLHPIYLLGCDHSYKGEKDKRKIGIIKNDQNNHFIKNYRLPGEKVNAAPIERMTVAHYHANEYAKKNNIQIINATRGGKLEVYDRVEFDTLFK